MAVSTSVGAELDGVHAAVAALDALDREDASLSSGAGIAPGVDVLQRRYEIRLERLGLTARLEAQLAAVKARDAAEALGFQRAMTPPDASLHDRTYAEMSTVEEIAGILTISSAAAGAFVDPATTEESPGWTSPTGRHYKPEHPNPDPPHWPPGTLPGQRSLLEEVLLQRLAV